jgi:murein L,D-transpeptidase YafK
VPTSIGSGLPATSAPRRARWRRCLATLLLGAVATLTLAAAPTTADRVLVEKRDHRLTLLRGGKPLKTYRVALGTGGLARKARAGDNLVPEGTYRVDSRNAHSSFHLALHVSYPSVADVERARAHGWQAGGDIMIHGLPKGYGWLGRLHTQHDWTRGCIAVADDEIEEIWRLVPNGTPVEIRP